MGTRGHTTAHAADVAGHALSGHVLVCGGGGRQISAQVEYVLTAFTFVVVLFVVGFLRGRLFRLHGHLVERGQRRFAASLFAGG